MNEFVATENQLRTGTLRKPEELESRIREINGALAPLEHGLVPTADPPPALFIFGLPRSGTTLCQQLVAYTLDVGYINNLIARFWRAPVHGIALSRHICGEARKGAYESHYGKSAEPWGVHEFSYFWHEALSISSMDDITSFGDSDRVDWADAARRVGLVTEAFRRPTVFKTLFAGEFALEFSRWMPKPLFIHVRRDLGDVALSLLRARIDYYGDPRVWWSTFPPNYQDIKALDFPNQIAGQVVGLADAYRHAAASLDDAQLIEVDYTDMTARPSALLHRVVSRLRDLYGTGVEVTGEPPRLSSRTRAAGSDDERAVLAALDNALRRSGM